MESAGVDRVVGEAPEAGGVAQRMQLRLCDWDSLMLETADGLRRVAASGQRAKAAQRKQPTPRSFAQATRGGGP